MKFVLSNFGKFALESWLAKDFTTKRNDKGVHRNFPHIFLGKVKFSKVWLTNIFGIWTIFFLIQPNVCLQLVGGRF
jgi:hypothetical protein